MEGGKVWTGDAKLDCPPDALVSPTAAEIAIESLVNLLLGWIADFIEETLSRDD
jgi:hypothetical protein